MPRSLTDNLKANLIRTVGTEPVDLIEIYSEQIYTDRILLTNCSREIVSNGKTYAPYPFSLTIQNDRSNETPTASLEFDNVSRGLTRWLEQLQGAPKAKLLHYKIQESDPDTLELNVLYDLKNITVNRSKISGRLGFDETINKIGNPVQYRKINSPGLF